MKTTLWTTLTIIALLGVIIIGIYSISAIHKTLDGLESRVELHRQALIEIGTFLEKQYGNDVK